GFCASKGTTIFMDHESNQIVHKEVGHSKEAGGSSKLGGFLFEKGLDYLLENGVRIKEVVTDASKTLISILAVLSYRYFFRTTWRLENFNSHSLLRYCPKRLSFSYDTYRARNELAVLDFNAHVNRGYNDTSCGQPSVRSQQSRRTKEWVAYRNLKEKQYSYLQGNMSQPLVNQ
ncbi:hypothetical protein FSP39_015367, partial [Pinctada imbricata]